MSFFNHKEYLTNLWKAYPILQLILGFMYYLFWIQKGAKAREKKTTKR
jgi:hypothetical protein